MPDIGLSRFQLPSQMLARNVGIEQARAQTAQTRQQTSGLEQQQRLQQQQFEQKAALQQLTQEAFQNPQALNALAGVDPQKASQIQEYQNNQAIFKGQAAMAFKQTDKDLKPQAYQETLRSLESRGIDTSQLPDEYDSALVDPSVDLAINSARDIEKQMAPAGISNTNAPSAVREFQFYESLSPQKKQDFLNVKRNTYQTGLTTDESGDVVPMRGIAEAKTDIKAAEARGTESGKLDVERRKNLAKANTALKSLETQSKIVTGSIDKALGTINKFSTGYGSYLSFLPNADARKLKNYLDTIKANVGFDKLQQMRDNSPTGGALGQVSEMENKLLQAVNGALDPAQADQLEANLKQIKALYPQVLSERTEAFNADYGQYLPNEKKVEKAIKRYNPETGRLE